MGMVWGNKAEDPRQLLFPNSELSDETLSSRQSLLGRKWSKDRSQQLLLTERLLPTRPCAGNMTCTSPSTLALAPRQAYFWCLPGEEKFRGALEQGQGAHHCTTWLPVWQGLRPPDALQVFPLSRRPSSGEQPTF